MASAARSAPGLTSTAPSPPARLRPRLHLDGFGDEREERLEDGSGGGGERLAERGERVHGGARRCVLRSLVARAGDARDGRAENPIPGPEPERPRGAAPLGQERRSHSLRHRDGLRRDACAARGPAHAGKRVEILVEHVVAAAAAPGSSPPTRPPGGAIDASAASEATAATAVMRYDTASCSVPFPRSSRSPAAAAPGSVAASCATSSSAARLDAASRGTSGDVAAKHRRGRLAKRRGGGDDRLRGGDDDGAVATPRIGSRGGSAPTRPASPRRRRRRRRRRQAQRAHGTGARGELEHLAEHPGALDQRRGTVSGIPGVPVDPGPSPRRPDRPPGPRGSISPRFPPRERHPPRRRRPSPSGEARARVERAEFLFQRPLV